MSVSVPAVPSESACAPRDEAFAECSRLERTEDSSERIRARNSLLQIQERPKPCLLRETKGLHILPALAHADHREKRDDQNVHQRVESDYAIYDKPTRTLECPHRRDRLRPADAVDRAVSI